MSAIAIKLLERAITRLRDRTPLTDNEQTQFDSYIDSDDREAFTISVFEYADTAKLMRDLIYKDLDGTRQFDPEFITANNALVRYLETHNTNVRHWNAMKTYRETAIEKYERCLAGNPRNPDTCGALGQRVYDFNQQRDFYIENTMAVYDALPERAKAVLTEPRLPIQSVFDFPRIMDEDALFWPNHPSRHRLPYIEYFENKLEKLKAASAS